ETSEYALEWMDDPWADLEAAGGWLLHLERRYAPDLIHLNGYGHASLAWRAPVLVVAHSCVLSWWQAVKGESAPISWARYQAAVASGIAAADLVVAPTAAMLASLTRNYGGLSKSRVIFNAVNPGRL